MTNLVSEIENLMAAYYKAAGADVLVASTYFAEPSVYLAGDQMRIAETQSEVASFLKNSQAAARENGMVQVTYEKTAVHLLSDKLAICSGLTVRRRLDGSAMEPAATTYVLACFPGGWKIRQVIPTDPDKILR